MRTIRIVAGIVIGALLLSAVPPVQAAAKKKPAPPPQPIVITADELYFSDKTGEMYARGNVVIVQDKRKIYADLLRGNEKQTEVWTDGKARLVEPEADVTGMKIRYNYGIQYGTLENLKGKCDHNFISGRQAEFQQGKYTVTEATTTTCKVKGTPDYRITARKVEIWPGDKLIAHDAKFWIKNTIIYSTKKYQTALKEDDDAFPRFGYTKKDGAYISQSYSFPVSDDLAGFVNLAYYTHSNFRPSLGLAHKTKEYDLRLTYGNFRDGDHNWIQKKPELSYSLKPRRIAKTPLSYGVNAAIGEWDDYTKSSFHQDYYLYLKHDPIHLDQAKTWTMKLNLGAEHLRESYDDSSQTGLRYRIDLEKKISPVLRAWAGYHYAGVHPLFAYNRADVQQEGVLGLAWKVTHRTTLSYSISYDFARDRTYETYYRVRQSFHCWELEVLYKGKSKSLELDFHIVKW